MLRVSNKKVNIGDVYYLPDYDDKDKPRCCTYNKKFRNFKYYYFFYQIVEYVGNYQVRLKALASNPFYKNDERFRNFDNRSPFIKNLFADDYREDERPSEFKAWVSETGDLREVGSRYEYWWKWGIFEGQYGDESV